MANHPSAKKRHRQNLKRRERNAAVKSRMRRAIKSAKTSLEEKAEGTEALVKLAVAQVQRAATKNVIRKGSASRHVSRLMKALGAH